MAAGVDPTPWGHGPQYALACWPDARGLGQSHEVASPDKATLQREAERLLASGAYRLIDLAYWSYEVNDWIRMETFERA
jgi:hypothetical protein